MKIDWSPLETELAIWRQNQLPMPIWWRDDDAITDTAELRKLLTLSDKTSLPVHLAVIPKHATPALRNICASHDNAVPLVHGWTHENHAPTGAKKAEFGHPRKGAETDTRLALARMQDLFGDDMLAMFVPPWNRIDPSVIGVLQQQGYRALSTYTPRSRQQVAGLCQINTHVDPIHWKAGGGLVPPERIISTLVSTLQDRRSGLTDATEPLGLLTHHLVHDDAIWDFTERCISVLLEGGATPCNLQTTKDLP